MLPCKWECRKQFWRCPAANSPMWKKTILATATKLKCTWKLPSPPLLFPSISTKLSTNFLPTHQPTPRSFSSSLRRKASSESLASLLQESGMMMHFSEARERRGGRETTTLVGLRRRVPWAETEAAKIRARISCTFRTLDLAKQPFILFYVIFWLRVSKWLKIWFFPVFYCHNFYSFFFFEILTDVSLLGASQSAFFFGMPKFGNWRAFFQKM